MRAKPKCPCLRQEIVATCAADTEAVRIPTQDHIARVCRTEQHRRCEIFRRFLGLRLAQPERPAEARRDDSRVVPAGTR